MASLMNVEASVILLFARKTGALYLKLSKRSIVQPRYVDFDKANPLRALQMHCVITYLD